jgi:hypothetical protein
MSAVTQTYPVAFINDCLECECDVGEIVKETARTITLRQSPEQLAELRSRAKHYAYGGLDGAPLWMTRSARAVLAKIDEMDRG